MTRILLTAAVLVSCLTSSSLAGPQLKAEAVRPDDGERRSAADPNVRAEKIPAIEGAGGPHEGLHEPMHGGALVPLGRDRAHLEFVFDSEQGLLVMHVLDGVAEEPIRLKQESVFLKLATDAGEFALVLFPRGDEATGERPGDTSSFHAAHRKLIGQTGFDVVIEGVTIGRQSYRRLSFRYPHGTELLP